MKLYTVCVQGSPVLTMSVDTELPMEDSLLTDPEFMKLHRQTQATVDAMREGGGATAAASAAMEIYETLDTWLGKDLRALTTNGARVWDGNRKKLSFREARTYEAEKWHLSRRQAIETEKIEAGEEDWVTFLVPVKDPTDDDVADDPDNEEGE